MRAFFLLFVCFLVLPPQSHADTYSAEPDEELAKVRFIISQQIAAFQNEDGELAFSFASPMIRSQFGSPQNFMMTVKNHYGSIYATQSFKFGKHVAFDGHMMQEVEFVGADDGGVDVAIYRLIKFKKLGWRITGVELIKKPESEI